MRLESAEQIGEARLAIEISSLSQYFVSHDGPIESCDRSLSWFGRGYAQHFTPSVNLSAYFDSDI